MSATPDMQTLYLDAICAFTAHGEHSNGQGQLAAEQTTNRCACGTSADRRRCWTGNR
jgi:hypothetical protein